MGCLIHKESKLNALQVLKDENIITNTREILDEQAFDDKHASLLSAVNRIYKLALNSLFDKEGSNVAKFGIKETPYNRTDSRSDIVRVKPKDESFNQIDDARKALGIYDSKESIGEYRKRMGLVGKPIVKKTTLSTNQVKPGVLELFDSNSKLDNIGTPEQYSAYLDTIFPDSKVKDIVYHGTNEENIKFKNNNTEGYFAKTKKGTPNAIFFSKNKAPSESVYNRKFNVPVILDLKNSFVRDDKGDRDSYPENYKTTINNAENNNYDGVQILNTHDNFNTDVFVVFEPEQIHILGSKQDVEEFKEFVGKVDQNVTEESEYNPSDYDGIQDFEKLIESGEIKQFCKIG